MKPCVTVHAVKCSHNEAHVSPLQALGCAHQRQSSLSTFLQPTKQPKPKPVCVCVGGWVGVKVTPQGPHDVVPLTSTVLSSLLASLELLFLLLLAERLLPCHLVSFFLCLCARVKCVFLPSSSFFLLLLSSFLFFFSFFFFFCNCSLSFLGH